MSQPAARHPVPRDRPRLTGRAAVLAVVVCAIALSLAYPVREYLGQRRQLDQLQAERQMLVGQLHQLQAQQRQLSSPAFIEQQARDQLHMCMRGQTCYVIINRVPRGRPGSAAAGPARPWYQRLWASVQQADKVPAR
jgi:cell division protein FtsL